jgi:hypothetical protein
LAEGLFSSFIAGGGVWPMVVRIPRRLKRGNRQAAADFRLLMNLFSSPGRAQLIGREPEPFHSAATWAARSTSSGLAGKVRGLASGSPETSPENLASLPVDSA